MTVLVVYDSVFGNTARVASAIAAEFEAGEAVKVTNVAETKAAFLAEAIETAGPGLRVSYGVRELDPDVEPETLIADADAAMFAAKRVRKTG